MQKKKVIYLSSFILLALMLFKVSALHVYSHQDNSFDQIENCTICDSAIENQNSEFVVPSTVSIDVPIEIPFQKDIFNKIAQNNSSKTIHFRLFGRPPPSIG